jgi:Skp family chaperone for outer membrane proteins
VKRTKAYLTALAGFGGMLLLAGTSWAQPPGGGAPPPAGGAPAAQSRPIIAVFNMAAVMRDYGKAKYQVWLLNKKRLEMSSELVKWRAEYVELQKRIQEQQVPSVRDEMAKRMLELSRKIQDRDSDINKALNDDASKIISQLYDEIKTVVDKTAEMNGYHIVFAYPDAVTEEELKSPMVKELKLKPPAAQPFYVAKHVDVTGVVIQTLNGWFPARDAQGQPVDVSKLPVLEAPGTPGTATPGAPPAGPAGPVGGAPPRP